MNINNGDTAFMMLATSMVCLMTPGLALFYGGLARKRNVLFIMMQSIISMGIITRCGYLEDLVSLSVEI